MLEKLESLVLIRETDDLQHRIKAYMTGTQESGEQILERAVSYKEGCAFICTQICSGKALFIRRRVDYPCSRRSFKPKRPTRVRAALSPT